MAVEERSCFLKYIELSLGKYERNNRMARLSRRIYIPSGSTSKAINSLVYSNGAISESKRAINNSG